MVMSAWDIVCEYGQGKMSARPGYYAGRRNTISDLNSDIIEMIYNGIAKEIGADAAKSFVNMVGEMTEDASATTFLNALYNLEKAGWKFHSSIVPENQADSLAQAIMDGDRMGQSTEQTQAIGMIGIMEMMFGHNSQSDALAITGNFLKKHASELDNEMPKRKKSSPHSFPYNS